MLTSDQVLEGYWPRNKSVGKAGGRQSINAGRDVAGGFY